MVKVPKGPFTMGFVIDCVEKKDRPTKAAYAKRIMGRQVPSWFKREYEVA